MSSTTDWNAARALDERAPQAATGGHARAKTDFDVLIVGAGLSGIGAAYYLRERCPDATYAILEGRETMGGTWDLFRYPGVRSDSDMFTLGFSFRPWHNDKAISDGQTILDYIRDTARIRHRQDDPLRPQGDGRELGFDERALDRARAARDGRRAAR